LNTKVKKESYLVIREKRGKKIRASLGPPFLEDECREAKTIQRFGSIMWAGAREESKPGRSKSQGGIMDARECSKAGSIPEERSGAKETFNAKRLRSERT